MASPPSAPPAASPAPPAPPAPPARGPSPAQSFNSFGYPPDKRQKLSHGPSPLGPSPTSAASFPPYSPQWSPHSMPPPPATSYPSNPLESFNEPQPVQSPGLEAPSRPTPGAGTMGPPERPQKPIDPNDITDMVALSGVDLRAEDEYLQQSYNRPGSLSTSFDTTQRSSTASPGSSFQQWSQGELGSQTAFQAGPPFNEKPSSPKSLEEELKEKHKRAARAYAASKQIHMRNPFLAAQEVRSLLGKRSYEEHVRFDARGVRDESIDKPLQPEDVQAKTAIGADGNGIVAARVVKHVVEQDSPVVEVLTLLSLACNERLRSTLEDAFATARARQHGSHGVVPPEWLSVADGTGPTSSATAPGLHLTGTSWDKAPGVDGSPRAAQVEAPNGARLPTPPTEPSPISQPTIAYKSRIPEALRSIAQADREAEKKRLQRRAERNKTKAKSGGATSEDPAAPSTESAANAAPAAEVAPPPAKQTKKQQAAAKSAAVNEEVQRRNANVTANLALGGGGKKYSWLSSASKAGSGGLQAGAGMGRPSAAATPAGGSAPGTPGGPKPAGEDPGLLSSEAWKKLGRWREDGPKGKGVQIRDFINVLERDGLEKRTLARCYGRLRSD